MTTSTGLWNESFGVVGATLKALQDAGATAELLKLIRSNPVVAKAVVKAGNAFYYANEEVYSDFTYPILYKGPNPIADQIKAIATIFGLDPSQALEFAKNLPMLPEGAEGWFAVPTVAAIARKHFPEVTDPVEKYCLAFHLVNMKIAGSRPFYNLREAEIVSAKFRAYVPTAQALDIVERQQLGDIWIIPAQLGMRHRGRSVRRARTIFAENEFGLTSLMVGSILLVHPEREIQDNQLHIFCVGDEFSFDVDGKFSFALIFYYAQRIIFDTYCFESAYADCGSASGFLF